MAKKKKRIVAVTEATGKWQEGTFREVVMLPLCNTVGVIFSCLHSMVQFPPTMFVDLILFFQQVEHYQHVCVIKTMQNNILREVSLPPPSLPSHPSTIACQFHWSLVQSSSVSFCRNKQIHLCVFISQLFLTQKQHALYTILKFAFRPPAT